VRLEIFAQNKNSVRIRTVSAVRTRHRVLTVSVKITISAATVSIRCRLVFSEQQLYPSCLW